MKLSPKSHAIRPSSRRTENAPSPPVQPEPLRSRCHSRSKSEASVASDGAIVPHSVKIVGPLGPDGGGGAADGVGVGVGVGAGVAAGGRAQRSTTGAVRRRPSVRLSSGRPRRWSTRKVPETRDRRGSLYRA